VVKISPEWVTGYFWIHENGTGQQVAQLHDTYDDDDDDDDDHLHKRFSQST
jgi:hypothetical protein